MEDLEIISLHEIIELHKNNINDIEKIKKWLSSFKCTKNKDEESFINKKAIEFDKQNITRTYLLVDANNIIKAYFSIGLKAIELEHIVSRSLRKQLASHLQSSSLSIPAYLIGHFSKCDISKECDYSNELMKYINGIVYDCKDSIGGRVLYLECEEIKKIKSLYESFEFKFLFQYISENKKVFNVYYKII